MNDLNKPYVNLMAINLVVVCIEGKKRILGIRANVKSWLFAKHEHKKKRTATIKKERRKKESNNKRS